MIWLPLLWVLLMVWVVMPHDDDGYEYPLQKREAARRKAREIDPGIWPFRR